MQKKSIFFNQKGATAVEFAIVLSLLITLMFGIIEFSLFIFNRQVITNAAREGARAGIIARQQRLSNDEIKTVVLNYGAQHLITFGNDVLTADDIVIPARCLIFQCDLEVQVDYEYAFLFLSNIGIGPLNLRATSLMRME
ncbi:MAG: pilus assembly protein [Deltaproteobacteria bacterium]|nr:pilus assembly protein [Deltaproteobacteria bacterium]